MSTYIRHVWSLCIVKEAMFIILIGLWPIRLFISDLYISGTHNFLIYIFYFTFFFKWEILCMVGSWETQRCRWMVAVFGKILEYCDSSVFIITKIMTMMMKPIKDIYFTFEGYLLFFWECFCFMQRFLLRHEVKLCYKLV